VEKGKTRKIVARTLLSFETKFKAGWGRWAAPLLPWMGAENIR